MTALYLAIDAGIAAGGLAWLAAVRRHLRATQNPS